LQDVLHYFLHIPCHVQDGNIPLKIFDETFAMLDKSVYHIFGEDCARCMEIAGFSPKSTPVFESHVSPPANEEARHRAIAHLARPHFAIFHTESVNYAYWRHVSGGN